MSRIPKDEAILTEDERDSVTTQESASISNDEGSKCFTRDGSISSPDKEKCESAQIELLRTTTDSEGYVASMSSAAEIQEGEKGATIPPPPEMQVNLLEKTRIWKNRQLRELQYDSLKHYYVKIIGRTGSFNWYKRFEDFSYKKPKLIEDLPCECDLEGEREISGNAENGCKGEMKTPTKQESSAEELNISIKSPIQKLAKHNSTCNARRICQYFSCIANYFIDEEVDPDMFLYIPFPKGKYGEDSVDYKYYILQESRKILILKLSEGLRRKLESWVDGMTKSDKVRYEYRNEVRIGNHLVLNNLLEDLVKPYENLTCTKKENNDDNSNSKQNASNHIADQIDQDKSKYLLLKDEYRSLKKRLEKEASERRNQVFFDDALHFDFYMPYEEFLEQKKSKENKPSTSKNAEMELDIENRIEIEQATDRPEIERKMSDSEQEAEESEIERKMNDSEQEAEEPELESKMSYSEQEAEESEIERKMSDSEQEAEEQEIERETSNSEQDAEESEIERKMSDSDQEAEEPESERKKEDLGLGIQEPRSKRKMSDSEEETEEPEGKRKKDDLEEETEEPEFKTKIADSEQETEELQGKRKMDDSDQETEKPEIKRRREGELSNEDSESRK